MSKFKVGDTVELVTNGGYAGMFPGDKGHITRVEVRGCRILCNGKDLCYFSHEFKAIDDDPRDTRIAELEAEVTRLTTRNSQLETHGEWQEAERNVLKERVAELHDGLVKTEIRLGEKITERDQFCVLMNQFNFAKEAAEKERDTLKARVAELEASLKGWEDKWDNAWSEERDQLRTQLEAVTNQREAAEAELATYKQPKLVKQDFTIVYPDGYASLYESREGATHHMRVVPGALGLLRRDHFTNPDGSTYVVATLEPVTEESK